MKKIVFFSEESIFSGNVKCGIAEVVDSLALALAKEYEVWVVCQEGINVPSRRIVDFENVKEKVSYARAMSINYYIIKAEIWEEESVHIVDELNPDIIHNFCDPSLISKLKARPQVSVFTFDDLAFLESRLEQLNDWDYITTFSNGYKNYILQQNSPAVEKLKTLNFADASCGIASEIFNPATGLLLKSAYSAEKLGEKVVSKKELMDLVGIQKECPIFLTMGNISHRKGADSILKAAPRIEELGGKLVIFGSAPPKYHQEFSSLADRHIISYNEKIAPTHIIPILAGADFYLQPSLMESGGLMPLAASRYGAIPIVTQNGGFADSFNDNNAIIVRDNILDSIDKAFELYSDYLIFMEKQKVCMTQDYGWNVRKLDYTKLYESKGE